MRCFYELTFIVIRAFLLIFWSVKIFSGEYSDNSVSSFLSELLWERINRKYFLECHRGHLFGKGKMGGGNMNKKNKDFYQKLRKTFQKWLQTNEGKNYKWADYLLFAPDLFHVLCKVLVDKDTPTEDKAKIAGAIAYFISPIDLLPEAILGPVGYADDIALAAYVLNRVINKSGPEIVQRHWAGDEDVLKVIRKILEIADQMIGSGLWKKLRGGERSLKEPYEEKKTFSEQADDRHFN
jgi:uncharacterized membrane protein YkvA (DUF1232 family)